MFGAEPSYQYMAVIRKEPGEPELHSDWDDVVIVRSGTGVLQTGSELVGQRLMSPGNWRGGTIQHSDTRQLSEGDIVVIPAGIAHQFTPSGTRPLTYWAVKGHAVNAAH